MTPFKNQTPVETKDLYQQVTDQIIEALSQSTNWIMPWHQKGLKLPQNVLTQNSYSGINILSLWIASYKNHYSSPLWGTYKQWQSLGAQVRKGEKSHSIVFYKNFEVEERNEETGEPETIKRFVLKSSSVFNVAQVEGFDNVVEEETLDADAHTFNPY
jgi:antirestriction protein ArdC